MHSADSLTTGDSSPREIQPDCARELPRTFRRSRRFRMRVYLGIALCVVPATVLVCVLIESYSLPLLGVTALFGLLSCSTVRGLARLTNKLTVDEERITSETIFKKTCMPYSDIVEVIATIPGYVHLPIRELIDLDVLKWSTLRVRSHSTDILCDRDFEDSDLAIDLIVSRVSEEVLDVPLSEEFRYPRSFRCLLVLCTILFLGIVIWALVSGLTEDHSDDFYSEVVFPSVIFGFFALLSLYAVLELGEKIYLERHRLVVTNWRGDAEIPYDQIASAERHQPWYDTERLVITYTGGRLNISDLIERYEHLHDRLNQFVRVKWRGEDRVQIPMTVYTRAWIGRSLYCLFGLLLIDVGVDQVIAYVRELFGSGALLAAFAAAAIGLGIITYTFIDARRRPSRLILDFDELAMTSMWRTRRYSADQVQHVKLLEKQDRRRIVRTIQIRVAGRTYVMSQTFCPVPFIPLYELLCKTYRPEDYREPGVKIAPISR